MSIYNGFFRRKDGGFAPEALSQVGLLLPVEISVPSSLAKYLASHGQPVPEPVAGFALIDTGATKSCIDSEAARRLGLQPINTIQLGTAAGPITQFLYPATFRFPAMKLEIEFSSVVGVDLTGQSVGDKKLVALIGRDVLARFILIYNGPNGQFSLAF